MTDREEVKEEIRHEIKIDLKNYSRVNDPRKVARFIDQQPLEKCVVSQYAQYRNNLKRTLEDDPQIEKVRDKHTTGYHPSDVPLEESFAEIYFNLMGHGVDGSDTPTGINEKYKCPFCGLRYEMSMKLMPEFCRCGHITPLGELIKIGFYKR